MPRAQKETNAINRIMRANGLPALDEPGAMVAQLAMLVQNHDHLREILQACEPGLRRDMYESMRPHLSFDPMPLDVYISLAGAIAEAKQLPTVNARGGLDPYKPAEITTIERAVAEAVATGHLTLTCVKCTRQESFPGVTKGEAVQKARNAGWTWDELRGDGREICPRCPGGSHLSMN